MTSLSSVAGAWWLRAAVLPLATSPHRLPCPGVLYLHSPAFLGRAVLKLLEKLLIFGNLAELLDTWEGTVIVVIAPGHSVGDGTCWLVDVQLVDLTVRVSWLSYLLLRSVAVGETQAGRLPLWESDLTLLSPQGCCFQHGWLETPGTPSRWPWVTAQPQGLMSLSQQVMSCLTAGRCPLDCVLGSSQLFAWRGPRGRPGLLGALFSCSSLKWPLRWIGELCRQA